MSTNPLRSATLRNLAVTIAASICSVATISPLALSLTAFIMNTSLPSRPVTTIVSDSGLSLPTWKSSNTVSFSSGSLTDAARAPSLTTANFLDEAHPAHSTAARRIDTAKDLHLILQRLIPVKNDYPAGHNIG